jgi:hypothetical protein
LGFETLRLSLPPPNRQMRVFHPVVFPQATRLVAVRESDLTSGGAMGPEFVGHGRLGVHDLVLQKFPQQPQRRVLVAPALDEHVQNIALVIDRAP